jgi:hypothetical protein
MPAVDRHDRLWLVKMRPGDLVFYWLASPDSTRRGLHGWGTLTSAPYLEGDKFRVKTVFKRRIRPHLTAAAVRAIGGLANLRIFTVRVGSNFALSEDETQALVQSPPPNSRPPAEAV